MASSLRVLPDFTRQLRLSKLNSLFCLQRLKYQNYTSNVKTQQCFSSTYSSRIADDFYDEDQKEMQKTLLKIIDTEINPHVQEWEDAGEAPLHKIFKVLGNAGLLGVNKPTEYSEDVIGKEKFSALWSELISKVNAMGPPAFTSIEWKTKWSQHKYNIKRKRVRHMKKTESLSQDQPSHVDTLGEDVASASYETVTVDSHPAILDKLDIIIEKQEALLVKMDITNSLLEVIARRA